MFDSHFIKRIESRVLYYGGFLLKDHTTHKSRLPLTLTVSLFFQRDGKGTGEKEGASPSILGLEGFRSVFWTLPVRDWRKEKGSPGSTLSTQQSPSSGTNKSKKKWGPRIKTRNVRDIVSLLICKSVSSSTNPYLFPVVQNSSVSL